MSDFINSESTRILVSCGLVSLGFHNRFRVTMPYPTADLPLNEKQVVFETFSSGDNVRIDPVTILGRSSPDGYLHKKDEADRIFGLKGDVKLLGVVAESIYVFSQVAKREQIAFVSNDGLD